MKKRQWALVAFIAILGIFIYNSDTEKPTNSTPQVEPNNEVKRNLDSVSLSKPSNIQNPNPRNLPDIVLKKIPTFAPAGLKGRWSHQSNFEDADYIDTQLYLDGKPIDGFFFKWSKSSTGEISELIAGIVPEVDSVNGSFPNSSEVQQIISSVIDSDTEVLSTQEIWNLNSNKVLTPQAKVEVQTKSRNMRSAGHEYWYISLNSGKIVKRLEADRN